MRDTSALFYFDTYLFESGKKKHSVHSLSARTSQVYTHSAAVSILVIPCTHTHT